MATLFPQSKVFQTKYLPFLLTATIFVLVSLARPLAIWSRAIPKSVMIAIVALSLIPLLYLLLRSISLRLVPFFLFLGISLLLAISPIEYMHIPLYGGIGFFFTKRANGYFNSFHGGLVAVGTCVAISFFDEGLQYLHPERFFDLRDLLLNFFSTLTGLCLVFVLSKRGISSHKLQ